MAHATMNSKQTDKNDKDVTLDYITMELQNGNNQGILELFKILIKQNNSLKSSLNEINTSIRNIKGASDELNHKLTKLQQHNTSSATIKEIVTINNDINHRSTNIITKYFTNNSRIKPNISTHSNSDSLPHSKTQTNGAVYNGSHCRDSIDLEHTNETVTDHDLSRLIGGIENSDTYFDDSSIQSITFVTDEHIMNDRNERRGSNVSNNSDYIYKQHAQSHAQAHVNQYHHRTRTHPESMQIALENIDENSARSNENENSVLSRHGSKEEIIQKLESGGKLLALLKKSDTKRVGKNKIIKFLEKKGVSQSKITEAYDEYYKENNFYEIIFTEKPLGFGVKKDNNSRNANISSIQNDKIEQTKNIKIGSMLYEINGKRVDGKRHEKILQTLDMQLCPFYIIFKHDENDMNQNRNESSMKSNIIHEHSIINLSLTKKEDIQDVVPPTNIDWEQVGQILLDHRFLPSAKLINQALDHLETFCHDEDLHENNWRDELCKAWSLLDDRGNILWQILYGNLKYSEKERRLFYDLMLHYYFKLNDMKTENIVFICTKILRDMKIRDIDLIKMKEILVINKIDGFSFNAEIKNANDFCKLFHNICEDNRNNIWEELYYELVAWKLDEKIRREHEDHQRKYKNKLDPSYNNGVIERKDSYNEITVFNDITRVSIRNDIDYEDSIEKKEWISYRHNLKNIFRFFAGWNASYMRKKELKRFIDILDIKKFWTTMHLLQDDMISMDQFIKYLCNEYINNRARDIKEHMEQQPEWTLLLNALKFLEEIDLEKNEKGTLQFIDFQKFGCNLSLNDLETKILFNKIDKNDSGIITIDQVFEWFKKKLLQKHSKNKTNGSKKSKRKITRRSKSDELQEID